MKAAAYHDFVIEVVRRLSGQQGFQDLAHLRVVEKTFGWMIRWHRLVRDYQRCCNVSEAMSTSVWARASSGASPIHNHSQTGS
jgi:hypothetical protein